MKRGNKGNVVPNRPPKLRDDVKEKLVNAEEYIPKGFYCYDDNGVCPFWDLNKNQPYQLNGYCHFLKAGDWMNEQSGGTFLLWDQVKECSINEYSDEEKS